MEVGISEMVKFEESEEEVDEEEEGEAHVNVLDDIDGITVTLVLFYR